MILFALVNQLCYALPLILVISLVYAATRHETMRPIIRHALRLGTSICGFMAVVFAILFVMSWAL